MCFYLEEVFNPLWVIAVALSTDSLHFFDLSCFTGSLDVLKVYIGLLAEIHNRPKEVKQAFDGREVAGEKSTKDSLVNESLKPAQKQLNVHLTYSLALIQHVISLHLNPTHVTPTLITLEGFKEFH